MSKNTTKECPTCKATNLVLLRTLNKKYCTGCHEYIEWYVEDGQKSVGYTVDKDANEAKKDRN